MKQVNKCVLIGDPNQRRINDSHLSMQNFKISH